MYMVPTNLSTNSDSKKVTYKMGCYILHTIFTHIIMESSKF